MRRIRVISFIDGFNLYHAIHDLRLPYLKWLDLWKLSKQFVPNHTEILEKVLYFSAYAVHKDKDTQERQRVYIEALKLRNVQPILGRFKAKDRKCPECLHKWEGHEEKATDVNIALQLLYRAYQDEYDRALLISNDSDLVPAIELVRSIFPQKIITTIVPPKRGHSAELIHASTNKSKITIKHLERCLLDEIVFDASRTIAVNRPFKYTISSSAMIRALEPKS